MPFTVSQHAQGVKGLAPLQRALKHAEGGSARELRKELKDIAEDVKMDAQANVSHRTGRSGGSGYHLGPSIKTSVAQRGAMLYSEAPHSIVHDVGGRVGKGAIISRSSASRYMWNAVSEAGPYVSRRLDGLLESIGAEFERG